MKKPVFILIVVSAFSLCANFLFSQPVLQNEAVAIGNAYIRYFENENEFSISTCDEIYSGNEILFYLIQLKPEGFMIVPASKEFPPVLAYSFNSNLGNAGEENPLLSLIKTDLSSRFNYYKITNNLPDFSASWNFLLAGNTKIESDSIFQQWPDVGDGWLKTNWTQSAPYDNFCPMDPVTSQRSIAGCPAVAMAQILNFHETTNDTQFDDGDDYYHNYAGRQYMIDDDYAANGFPSFPELNAYLDTLNMHYDNSTVLTNNDKAALTFACGVAATQVYTSSGSGTFSVSQALNAYLRFGFSTVELLDSNDTDLYDRLKQNIKDTLPAHLAIVDSAWSTGHNVVVDGYNTDEYYHLNFGWGGSYNAWYLLPQEIPYDLTVIEGVVVDIVPPNTASVGDEIKESSNISLYPNPCMGFINIASNDSQKMDQIIICDIQGKILFTVNNPTIPIIDISGLAKGLYVIKIISEDEINTGQFIKL
jgi:hypothetical protein